MEDTPLVSVALCTYNGGQFLKPQLDTLVNQTYANIEVVAVDDCSTDHTFAILEDYASRYTQFKISRNEKNLGFAANFEKAIGLCNGELIALCDQDDLWLSHKIEMQVGAIKDNIFIYHDSEFINEDGSSMNKKMSDMMNLYRGSEPETFLFFNCVSGHAVLMKKTLLDDALPLPKDFFHDWWLAYVATSIGKIDFIPECLVRYRQHERSDTNILRLEREKDVYRFNSAQKLERTYKWLGYCASFAKNRNPELVNQIYRAFAQRMNSYMSFGLSRLLYKYRETIFYVRKKGKLSNLNYIYGQVWGLKTKKRFSKK